MGETPEQRIARLQAELAQAKVEALQTELARARQQGGAPVPEQTDDAFAPVTLSQPGQPHTPIELGGNHPDWFAPVVVTGEQAREQLGQLREQFGVSLDELSRRTNPSPNAPADTRLAPAPRRVPAVFRGVLIPWSTWTAFALFMVLVAPIAIWIAVPVAAPITGAVGLLAALAWLLRGSLLRDSLLKWGEVARVTNVDVTARGTYYSGTTYQNVRLAQAHGWDVERRWYSGPGTTTLVAYEVGGTKGALKISGLPYDDGVILADPRKPSHALCVSSFPYDLHRDAEGNWTGRLAPRTVLTSLAMLVVLAAWVAAMAAFSVG